MVTWFGASMIYTLTKFDWLLTYFWGAHCSAPYSLPVNPPLPHRHYAWWQSNFAHCPWGGRRGDGVAAHPTMHTLVQTKEQSPSQTNAWVSQKKRCVEMVHTHDHSVISSMTMMLLRSIMRHNINKWCHPTHAYIHVLIFGDTHGKQEGYKDVVKTPLQCILILGLASSFP